MHSFVTFFFSSAEHVRHNFFPFILILLLVVFIFPKSPFIFLFQLAATRWCVVVVVITWRTLFFSIRWFYFVLSMCFFLGPRHRWTWLCILMRIWNASGETLRYMWVDVMTVNVIQDAIFFSLSPSLFLAYSLSVFISTKCISFCCCCWFCECHVCSSCVWTISKMLNALL